MKRLTVLSILLMLFCVILGACSHTHVLREETIKEATCTEEGTKRKYCAKCDYSITEAIPAAGHDYGEPTVLIEATCKQEGKCEYCCKVCGDMYEETIPLAEHDYGKPTVLVEASCSKDGKNEYRCKICGETKEETVRAEHVFVDGECTKCGAEKIDWLEADTWYVSKDIDGLQVKNCVVNRPTALQRGILVTYYPVCKKCHITGNVGWETVSRGQSFEKYYYCWDCGTTTLVEITVE